MKHRLLDAAQQELEEAVRYYASQDAPRAAVRFRAAVREKLQLIVGLPRTYRRRFGVEQVADLKRFPYAVVYYCTADEVVIVAIAHHKRKPGYWQHSR